MFRCFGCRCAARCFGGKNRSGTLLRRTGAGRASHADCRLFLALHHAGESGRAEAVAPYRSHGHALGGVGAAADHDGEELVLLSEFLLDPLAAAAGVGDDAAEPEALVAAVKPYPHS